MSEVDKDGDKKLRPPALKQRIQTPAAGGCDSSGIAKVDASPQALPGSLAESAGSPTDVASSSTDVAPIPLVGETRLERRKHRDDLRAAARRNTQPSPSCYNPHGYLEVPDLCNRVGTEWGTQPAECKCAKEWPKFMAAAFASGQAKHVPSAECYDGVLTMIPGQKTISSYRRPGGNNMKERWWYNGLLDGFVLVHTKTGQSKSVAIVN